jgi:hypothetical protein
LHILRGVLTAFPAVRDCNWCLAAVWIRFIKFSGSVSCELHPYSVGEFEAGS